MISGCSRLGRDASLGAGESLCSGSADVRVEHES